VTPKDRARALMLADENVRPYKDSKILGRVEQWVASPRAMAGAMKRRTDAAKRH
jgi:hypothetical protein